MFSQREHFHEKHPKLKEMIWRNKIGKEQENGEIVCKFEEEKRKRYHWEILYHCFLMTFHWL